MLLTNFKERPSKLEKGYSQVLVKQTVDIILKHVKLDSTQDSEVKIKSCLSS